MKIKLSIGTDYDTQFEVTVPLKSGELKAHRDLVSRLIQESANVLAERIEVDQILNPKPQDEPCCDRFPEGFRELDDEGKKRMKFCAFCGTSITSERREKYK